ncbi:MAG: hypothetical protein ACQEWF_09750 [Bacillota bacterium]
MHNSTPFWKHREKILTEGANMSLFNKRIKRIPKQLLPEKSEVVPEFLTIEEKISYFRNGLFNTDDLKYLLGEELAKKQLRSIWNWQGIDCLSSKNMEKINWAETYPTITIVPTIKVDIVGHGIIN